MKPGHADCSRDQRIVMQWVGTRHERPRTNRQMTTRLPILFWKGRTLLGSGRTCAMEAQLGEDTRLLFVLCSYDRQ